jgi:Tol biopolymer transport system component
MKDGGAGRDLYILPAAGGTPRRLTNLPGLSCSAAWAPDGRTIYFVSGKEDTSNIWKLSMDPETGLATGEPQQVTFFKDAVVMAPKVLGDGSRIGFNMIKLNTYVQIADTSSPNKAASLVRCGPYSPELSPDGQTVYYVNHTPGEEGIYAVSRHGGASRRLTKSLPFDVRGCENYRRFGLSPDGLTLAYSTIGNEPSLFIQRVSGGEPQLLVKLSNGMKFGTVPQWSPDGSQLAYADGNDLNLIAAGGGEPRTLGDSSCFWEPYSVRWSPDGKSIAAFGWPKLKRPPNAVFVVSASGGELRRLPSSDAWKEGLEWHPDGQRLTYVVVQLGKSETHQTYLDGREPTLLVDAPDVWDYVGAWAPDGRRFFFIGELSDRTWNMYVYDESSGETTKVSEDGEIVGVPRFSRDGKTIAWWASRRTSTQTWIMEDFLPESTAGE